MIYFLYYLGVFMANICLLYLDGYGIAICDLFLHHILQCIFMVSNRSFNRFVFFTLFILLSLITLAVSLLGMHRLTVKYTQRLTLKGLTKFIKLTYKSFIIRDEDKVYYILNVLWKMQCLSFNDCMKFIF